MKGVEPWASLNIALMKRVVGRLPLEGVVGRGLLRQLLGRSRRAVGPVGAEVVVELVRLRFRARPAVSNGLHLMGLSLVLLSILCNFFFFVTMTAFK
jgi:hypothetical protein